MVKIGGGPKVPGAAVPPTENKASQDRAAGQVAGRGKSGKPAATDKFEGAKGSLAARLGSLSGARGPVLGGKLSSADLAQVIQTFAAVLRRNPKANRKERAKLFAKSLLKGKKLGKLFADASESDLDDMFEAIAEQLDGSPVIADLVDDVSEHSLHYNGD